LSENHIEYLGEQLETRTEINGVEEESQIEAD
jgi:hypothetical protein